jgi:hypothetical protein
MDLGAVSLEYGFLRFGGCTKEQALGKLANRYEVNEEGVKRAISPYEVKVLEWIKTLTTNSE